MPPSDPAACPNCTSPQRGVRYSDDPGALCGHSWHDKPSDPAAVPPRTSCCQHYSDCAQHNAPAEPVGPCDCGKGGPPCGGEPVPPPDWALDAAHEYFSDQWTHLGIPNGIAVNVSPLARLLASVREGAILQCRKAVVNLPWECDDNGNAVTFVDGAIEAILSLLHTPPSGGAG